MKRVFASTEYKVLGRASYGGGTGNEQRVSIQEVMEDEMKVSYRIPEAAEAEEALEVEDVFATLDASEP